MKRAVVYYTRFGHSRTIAEAVASELGAELHRIETPKHHGFAYMGFTAVFNIQMRIQPMELDFSEYDLLVLCTPIWAGKPASPTRTFLRDAKLPKRLAVCFSTGGGETKRAEAKMLELVQNRGVEIVATRAISTEKANDDELRGHGLELARKLPV